jgi:hypothetical protein
MPAEEHPIHDKDFDELAKGLASGSMTRWQALRLLGGALLGTFVGFSFLKEEALAESSIENEVGGGHKHKKPSRNHKRHNGRTPARHKKKKKSSSGPGHCPRGTTRCKGKCVSNVCRGRPFNHSTCQCGCRNANDFCESPCGGTSNFNCVCLLTVEGHSFCAAYPRVCSASPECTSSALCPSGSACISASCCSNVARCLPACS